MCLESIGIPGLYSGYHLQDVTEKFAIKRTILIVCTVGHFRGTFCLLFEVGDASEASLRQDPECKLGRNKTLRSCLGVDSEAYPYHGPGDCMRVCLIGLSMCVCLAAYPLICLPAFLCPFLSGLSPSTHSSLPSFSPSLQEGLIVYIYVLSASKPWYHTF